MHRLDDEIQENPRNIKPQIHVCVIIVAANFAMVPPLTEPLLEFFEIFSRSIGSESNVGHYFDFLRSAWTRRYRNELYIYICPTLPKQHSQFISEHLAEPQFACEKLCNEVLRTRCNLMSGVM